jgi:hypothetical protein
MYPVIVHVLLHGKDGITTLSRSLELPFPPSPGLELEGLTTHPEPSETIQRVVWNLTQRCFYAELEDWDSDDETITEMTDYFGRGWEAHEPFLVLLHEE